MKVYGGPTVLVVNEWLLGYGGGGGGLGFFGGFGAFDAAVLGLEDDGGICRTQCGE